MAVPLPYPGQFNTLQLAEAGLLTFLDLDPSHQSLTVDADFKTPLTEQGLQLRVQLWYFTTFPIHSQSETISGTKLNNSHGDMQKKDQGARR